MRSTTTFVTALLASSVAVAQPRHHGHQRRHHQHQPEKRDLEVVWETVWETATVYVDETTTETVLPEKTPEPEPEINAAPPSPPPSQGEDEDQGQDQDQDQESSTVPPGQFFETPTETPTTLATSTSAPPPPPPPPASTTTTPAPPPQQPTVLAPPPAPEAPTSKAEPTSSAAPPPVESPDSGNGGSSGGSSGGSGSGVSGKGDITYYQVGLGSCGYDDSGEDDKKNIVALPKDMWMAESTLTSYGLDQPAHPWCDKTVTIKANGNSIQAVVRDLCPGCDGGSIDVTEHAYIELFGDLTSGRAEAEWFMN